MNVGAARRRGRAGHRVVRVAGAEGRAGEFLGCRAVGVFEQRREVLRRVLILEAVDEILGRKLVGGQAAVAQQVAHGVVVLAVRQAAQHDSRAHGAGAGGLLVAVVHRLGQLVALELRQAVDPRAQRGFLGTAGLDALSAGMRQCGPWAFGAAANSPGSSDLPAPPAISRRPRSGRRARSAPEIEGGWPTPRHRDCGSRGIRPLRRWGRRVLENERGLGGHPNRRARAEYPDQQPRQSGLIISLRRAAAVRRFSIHCRHRASGAWLFRDFG